MTGSCQYGMNKKYFFVRTCDQTKRNKALANKRYIIGRFIFWNRTKFIKIRNTQQFEQAKNMEMVENGMKKRLHDRECSAILCVDGKRQKMMIVYIVPNAHFCIETECVTLKD